ncbi:hypothetical protein [Brevibacterium atlanticum]|uniref:hypothetical protein n=1 Tax=Brevibacterium atlanticum TaxID=2697563 RepID=UPI0014220A70|nr:hypothetical protein [Brevibacterium atlanticum]
MMNRQSQFGGWARPGAAMITAVVLTLGVSGCTGPDLSNTVDDIGGVLSASPGVEDVETSYLNGFDSGRSINYRVTMDAAASAAQATEVAAALDRETGDEFDRYTQNLSLIMAGRTIKVSDATNGDIMAAKVPRLLEMSSTLSVDKVSWSEQSDGVDFDDSLEISDAGTDPFRTLDAARAQFGSEEFQLSTRETSGVDWYVAFPFSEQGQERLESVFDPLRTSLNRLNIDGDQVSSFVAVVPAGADEVTRLRGIIDRIESTTTNPWDFSWAEGADPTGPFDYSSGGIVNVGGCEYDEDAEGQLTQTAQTIQDQLRDSYDTCR